MPVLERNVAVCYERLSYSKRGEDDTPPEKQRRNNLSVCSHHGFVPEIYSDIEGHRSGRTIANRPAWQQVEKRIELPDVVALVANDLARLHRKGWRIGQLVEKLDRLGVRLLLSAPGRQLDSSTPQGKMFVQWMAAADEYYAEDVALRQRNSIRRRKEKGITVGMPPFGTIRSEQGYLMERPDGVWLMPDGAWRAGTASQRPPDAVLWRGYYGAMLRVLELYAQGQHGYGRIADFMNREGWAFRTRHGDPRPFEEWDVRQVVGSIYTYGGLVQNVEG